MSLAIEARGVEKHFGAVKALAGVDLDVERGSVVGLLGPNGAGKTTMVKVLSTLLLPTSGTAKVGGFDVVTQADEVRHTIGLTGQYAAVDEYLTGRENLHLFGALYHLPPAKVRERAEELLEQFTLTDAADRTLKTYSGGMRRRLDLAAALVANPPVLFLDEPTTGLDPQSRQDLWVIIENLVASGVTSTHSSSRANSKHSSRESFLGGVSAWNSSDEDARMLVSFFSLVMFTSMSSPLAFSPTTIPA